MKMKQKPTAWMLSIYFCIVTTIIFSCQQNTSNKKDVANEEKRSELKSKDSLTKEDSSMAIANWRETKRQLALYEKEKAMVMSSRSGATEAAQPIKEMYGLTYMKSFRKGLGTGWSNHTHMVLIPRSSLESMLEYLKRDSSDTIAAAFGIFDQSLLSSDYMGATDPRIIAKPARNGRQTIVFGLPGKNPTKDNYIRPFMEADGTKIYQDWHDEWP